MSHLDASTLATYNSLIDPHLQCYFSNERIRSHLRHAGLISRRGEVVPESEYRSRLAEREHRKHVRQMLAENIVHRAIDMERSRQAELRRQFEMVAKAALVNSIKDSRRRGAFPPSGMSASADMGLISMSSSWSQSRPKSANVHRDFGMMNDEFADQPRIPRVQSAHVVGEQHPIKQSSKSPRRRRRRRLHRPTSSNPIHRSSPLQRPRSSGKYSDSSPLTPPCKITMIYYGPHTKVDYDHTIFEPVDEVMVMQQHCGGENLIVYKGIHKAGERFAFNSRRHADYPFGLSLYVKGLIDSRISTCCEYKHRHGVRLGGERGHFGIVSVDGSKPCLKCRFEKQARLKKDAESPKEKSADRKKPITISIPVSDEPKGKQTPVKIPVRSAPSASDNYTEDFDESGASDKETAAAKIKKSPPKGGYTSDTDTLTSRDNDRQVKPRDSSSKIPLAPVAQRVSKARVKSSSSTTSNDRQPQTKTWQVIFHTSNFPTASFQSKQKTHRSIDGHLKISFIAANPADETESYNIDLRGSASNFKPGQKAPFAVKLRPIGAPKQIRLKLEMNKDDDETKWHLHQIEIIDPENQTHTNFDCGEWIRPSVETILNLAEEKPPQRHTSTHSSDSSTSPPPPPQRRPVQRRASSDSSASDTPKRQAPIERTADSSRDAILNNGSDESVRLASDRNSLHQSNDEDESFEKPQEQKSPATVQKKSIDEGNKIHYRITIYPSATDDGMLPVEDDSRIFVRVNDEGNVKDLQKKGQLKLTPFKPGESQTFEVDLTQTTQGQPTTLTIGYQNSYITASKWNIDKVVVTNDETGEETIFYCDDCLVRDDYNHKAEKTFRASVKQSDAVSSDDDRTIRNNAVTKPRSPSVHDEADSDQKETPKAPIEKIRRPSAQVQQQPTTTTTTEKQPNKSGSSSPSFKSMKDEEAHYRTIFKQLDPNNEFQLGSPRSTQAALTPTPPRSQSVHDEADSDQKETPKAPIEQIRPPSAQVRQQPTTTTTTAQQPNKSDPNNELRLGSQRSTQAAHTPTPPRSQAPPRPRTRHGRQDPITTDTQQERTPDAPQARVETWRPASATGNKEPVEPLNGLEDLTGQTARSTEQQNKNLLPATTNNVDDQFKNWYPNKDDDEDDD